MSKLSFVLCLSLLCGLGICGPPGAPEPAPSFGGGFGGFGGLSPLSEDSLSKLHPRLHSSFTEWGKEHNDFGVTLKRIISGQSQVVAGTRYLLTIETEHKNNEVKQCEADIWEKTWENFFQVKLTCQEKFWELHTKVPA